jgi:hypothetical protein
MLTRAEQGQLLIHSVSFAINCFNGTTPKSTLTHAKIDTIRVSNLTRLYLVQPFPLLL